MTYTKAGLFMVLAGIFVFMTFMMTELDIAHIGIEQPEQDTKTFYEYNKTVTAGGSDYWDLNALDYDAYDVMPVNADIKYNGDWQALHYSFDNHEPLDDAVSWHILIDPNDPKQPWLFVHNQTESDIEFDVRGEYRVFYQEAEIGGAWDMVKTLFAVMTFQAIGMPSWFVYLFIYPITFGLFYLTVEIVKDLIPFT